MRVAVLGPLEVTANDSASVDVPGAQERLLLALLAAHAPDAVPMDRLRDALGGGDPDEPGAEPVHAAVHRLRGALEPGLPDRASGQYVLRRGHGYALTVSRSDVDALRFTDLAVRGSARVGDDPSGAAWLLTTALGLWRGEPYVDWPDAPFAEAERRRLDGIRHRAEADLREAHVLDGREGPVARPRPAVVAGGTVHESPRMPSSDVRPPLPGPSQPVPEPGVPPHPGVREADAAPVVPARSWATRPPVLITGLVVVLAAALAAAALSGRSDHRSQQAAVTDANKLAALSAKETRLDTSLLLAAQAFRLANTPETRGGLAALVDGHARVERAVSFRGEPQDPVLSGGNTVTFSIGGSVVGWPMDPRAVPSVVMDIPGDWGRWIFAAPTPVSGLLLSAGVSSTGPWLRTVSALEGTNRSVLEGDQVGGRPVDGAALADARRLLLLVAGPDAAGAAGTSRWRVIDVDVVEGSTRDTGIAGSVSVPVEGLRADFADRSDSVVVWGDSEAPTATLVQLIDGSQAPISTPPRTAGVIGFRATPTGAAEMWADGTITLVDRAGTTIQELHAHQGGVADIAVSPDGQWAVSAGAKGQILRWDIDPATGQWSDPTPLAGHSGNVVGVEVDPTGDQLVSVAVDHTIISWDMRRDGGRVTVEDSERLDAACAIVARDFTRTEWRRFLPDRPWQPTCSDLS